MNIKLAIGKYQLASKHILKSQNYYEWKFWKAAYFWQDLQKSEKYDRKSHLICDTLKITCKL